MVNELNIAGEFIYDGIDALNRMSTMDEIPLLFSFLYHVSVGIERIQKIILVLFELDEHDDYQAFEKSMISHSHIDLNRRIKEQCSFFTSTPRENAFLAVLSQFYITARYSRFNVGKEYDQERRLISEYIQNNLASERIERHFFTGQIIVNHDVKELFGRVIGSLAKKYYCAVREGCEKTSTFSYELQPNSKAERIFYSTEQKNSLYREKINESIAFKEFLVYFRNTSDSNPFIRFIESIEPLGIDPGMINEYISELSSGTIPQSLLDEVETLYDGISIKDRIELVSGLGEMNANFEWIDVNQCYLLLADLREHKCECKGFATSILPIIDRIKEDGVYYELVDNIPDFCRQLLENTISEEVFLKQMDSYYKQLDQFYKKE
jgi:hypothetical protein